MPQPLEAMERSGVRGVIFDIDDTLTSGGKLQEVAFSALWRLRRAGRMAIAITGRPLGWIDVIARMWPIDVGVGENGAGWVRDANVADASGAGDAGLRCGYFEEEAVRRAQVAQLRALVARTKERFPQVQLSRDHHARRCDLAFDIREEASLSQEEVRALESWIIENKCHVSTSSIHCHASPGMWNKFTGARKAIEDALELAFDPQEWVFVGDSGNDAEAFANFPRSVGVANVQRHLDALGDRAPRFVTAQARGEGFAALVDYLLLAVPGGEPR